MSSWKFLPAIFAALAILAGPASANDDPPYGTKVIGTAPACGAKPSDCSGDHPHFITKLGSGGGHNCTSGTKVLCGNKQFVDQYMNYYWEGTAPSCAAGKSDCGSDTYLMNDFKGAGAPCLSGHKVLCAIRK